MAYRISAIVMILSILEGHSPIASLFKCAVLLHLQSLLFLPRDAICIAQCC